MAEHDEEDSSSEEEEELPDFQRKATIGIMNKLNSVKSRESLPGFDSMNNTSQQFTIQDMNATDTAFPSPKKKKLISMRDYITNFTKQNNIDL